MGYPIHPLSNAGVAGQYLNQLTSDNISQRYFSGQQSYTGGLFNRIKLFFNIDGTLNELKNFYPYVPIVKSSHEAFTSESANALTNSLAITALSWFTIFSLARKGKVLPFFNQYCTYFKTHRIFRQYLFTMVAPYVLFQGLLNLKYLNHTEHLWMIHSKRMNQQITSDPQNSEYPEKLLPTSWTGSWTTPYRSPLDLKKKFANEVDLLIAPDYTEPQYEMKEMAGPEEGDQEQGEEE